MKIKTIYESLYRADVKVITDCSFQDFLKELPEQTFYSWGEQIRLEEGTDGYQFHTNGLNGEGEQFFVWIYEPDPYMIAHEFHHLAHDILYTRGVEYCSQSEEAFAYLTGRLTELYRLA